MAGTFAEQVDEMQYQPQDVLLRKHSPGPKSKVAGLSYTTTWTCHLSTGHTQSPTQLHPHMTLVLVFTMADAVAGEPLAAATNVTAAVAKKASDKYDAQPVCGGR